jgi:trimethylamine--corrinoid protein Co-methyltransferase
VTLVWGVGSLESELSISPEKLVLDDEYARAAMAAVRPIEVSDETLAEDIMVAVGRGEGFLGHEHTFRHFRTALWQPALAKRGRRESWVERGGRTLEDAAREKVREILDREPPHYLTDAQVNGLREIEKKWLARI